MEFAFLQKPREKYERWIEVRINWHQDWAAS
jgi:hypothetical protein